MQASGQDNKQETQIASEGHMHLSLLDKNNRTKQVSNQLLNKQVYKISNKTLKHVKDQSSKIEQHGINKAR